MNLDLTSNLAFLQAMNGQYLCNRQITVSYAYKKDTKGERHGTPAGKNLCLRKMKLRILGCGYLSLIKIVELCYACDHNLNMSVEFKVVIWNQKSVEDS